MPLPILALAGMVALAALRERSDSPPTNTETPAEDTAATAATDTGDTVSSQPTTPPNLSARTLSWRDELAAQAPELDVAFLLRWIQRESDGNPASVGSIVQLRRDGWAREAGIGQLYFEARTQRVFGATSDELRAGAIAGTQNLSRDLTEPERLAQTSSLIQMARQYIADGEHTLGRLGAEWSADDGYCLAKLKHALPVLSGAFLLHCPDATSWDTFRAWLEALSLADSAAIYSGSASYYGSGGLTGWTRYLNNAQYTGRGS